MYKNYRLVKEIMDPAYVKSLPEADLPAFCAELRQELIDIISTTGGHIGVNLGILELTVALYRVFDFPKDFLVWDIGHQIYVQKMLTSRLPLLREIRKNGGSPGYAYHVESEYEHVTSSHAGASLSFALGAATAARLAGSDETAIAVIGDGSFVEGSNQEALNHLAVDQGKVLYILNDNEMALDANFGGWHEHFKAITRNPEPMNVFELLGLDYEGPVDGHDILGLVATLKSYKENQQGPAVLHVKTVKGKGLETMAEKSPVRIHWNFPFDTETLQNTEGPKSKSYAACFAEALGDLMQANDDLFVVTPATLQNTGIYGLSRQYPQRILDVGMAEQHAITFAGGLARKGLKPVVAFESTFLQRTYDQVVHDLCISDIPVMIVAARSGHTGLDHTTHHALLDLSYLTNVPNLRVVFPATEDDFKRAVAAEYAALSKPTLVLFPYGGLIDDPADDMLIDHALGSALDASASDTLILSVGLQHKNALALRDLLTDGGIKADHVAVTDFEALPALISKLAPCYKRLVTLEENIRDGGFGSKVRDLADGSGASVDIFAFPTRFIEHGTRDYIYQQYGLDAATIAKKLTSAWAKGQA